MSQERGYTNPKALLLAVSADLQHPGRFPLPDETALPRCKMRCRLSISWFTKWMSLFEQLEHVAMCESHLKQPPARTIDSCHGFCERLRRAELEDVLVLEL